MKKLFIYIFFVLIAWSCSTSKKAIYIYQPELTEEEERDFKYNFYEGLRLKDENLYQNYRILYEKLCD